MRIDLNLFAAATAFIVGFSAFWSNWKRPINQVFLTLSVHTAVWLLAVRTTSISYDKLFWLRITTAIGSFIPLHLWFIKETLANPKEPPASKFVRGWGWILMSSSLGIISITEWYIPSRSTSEHPIFGVGYYIYTAGLILGYVALFRKTLLQARAQSGVNRLELQLLLLGGCAAASCIALTMVLRVIFGPDFLGKIRPQPLVILVFYGVTVVAISTHRVFDARQILLVGLRKSILVAIIASGAFVGYRAFEALFPDIVAFLVTTAATLWGAALLNDWLDRLMQFYPEAKIARQAAFTAAQRETRADKLEKAFCSVLKGWGQSEKALILTGNRDGLNGEGVTLAGDGAVVEALRQLQWATPERLLRERTSENRSALAEFLLQHQLGVIVIADGPSLSIAVGVGLGASHRPFTYPQVTQLMELASIMESALERAHFSTKVQHTEQLATVGLLGASLAHEIRNPLVSIKTFVQLLPTHYQDPRFREKFFQLIGDEVGRIDQLTEQLLDLASPRAYNAEMIELHPVLQASLNLVSAKAAHKNVHFITEFRASPDTAFTDASAAKQVMLNLCFNAIQAAEIQQGQDRWVRIATRNIGKGVEMAVADSGPGIAPEIRPRIFQPFQTTKSSGFGLGLAICSDILANLNASITVDPPVVGQGATFRVIFPCQPSSS